MIIKNASIEAHHFIDMAKCYHKPLRQVYSIFIIEIPCIQPNLALQIALKAMNNLLSFNRLVSTLLGFYFYF